MTADQDVELERLLTAFIASATYRDWAREYGTTAEQDESKQEEEAARKAVRDFVTSIKEPA